MCQEASCFNVSFSSKKNKRIKSPSGYGHDDGSDSDDDDDDAATAGSAAVSGGARRKRGQVRDDADVREPRQPTRLRRLHPRGAPRARGCAAVTGGGACLKDADCSDKGKCTSGKCACQEDGMVAGAHCELFAIQCPEYRDAACCSWQQNQGMAENFKLLASVFGKNSGGGCDACATNLLNLWCGIVCSPRQAEFMKMHLPFPSINYRPDPMTGEDHVKVLEMDVTLDKTFTCSVFDSCKNTAIASMSEGMKSSLGFLNYQMQTGAVGHGEYMYLSFAQSSAPNVSESSFTGATATGSFNHHVLKCDNYSEVVGVESLLPMQAQLLSSIANEKEPKQCPCGACRSTCDAHTDGDHHIKIETNPISLLDGFNGKLVALIYGAIFAAAVLLKWRKSH